MLYDINLIPKSKKSISNYLGVISLLIGVVVLSVVFLFGFYLPLQKKNAEIKKIVEMNAELTTYSQVQTTYTNLLNQKSQLVQMESTLESIKGNKTLLTELLKDIENAIPSGITLSSIKMDNGMIMVDGISPSYEVIAQFIVKLRSIEDITDVSFTSASVEESANGLPIGLDQNSEEEKYSFTVYVNIATTNILQPLQNEEDVTSSMDQEVVENETDK